MTYRVPNELHTVEKNSEAIRCARENSKLKSKRHKDGESKRNGGRRFHMIKPEHHHRHDGATFSKYHTKHHSNAKHMNSLQCPREIK